MPEQKRILAIVDPTADAHPAVERAKRFAHAANARVELFICDNDPRLASTDRPGEPMLAQVRADVLAEHRRRLESLAQPLRAAGLGVDVDARCGSPLHEGIVTKAAEARADLVVKDTHYHSALRRSIFTNTDWHLIRECAAPLWLVKPGPLADTPRFLAAVDPLHARAKSAALDDAILDTASRLCLPLGGELDVLHAYDVASTLAVAVSPMTASTALPVRELLAQVRDEHAAAVHALTDARGIARSRVHVEQGTTAQVLLALAERLSVNVVVMGAVSRRGVARLFLGNTAEAVLDKLPCDLVIVKPAGFASGRSR